MVAGRRLKKILDGEEIWRKWHGAFDSTPPMSLAEIHDEYLASGKYFNPETGKPVSRSGLCESAWRWAIDHYEMSMPMVIAAWEYKGDPISEQELQVIYVERAIQVFERSRIKLNRFLTGQHLEEVYNRIVREMASRHG